MSRLFGTYSGTKGVDLTPLQMDREELREKQRLAEIIRAAMSGEQLQARGLDIQEMLGMGNLDVQRSELTQRKEEGAAERDLRRELQGDQIDASKTLQEGSHTFQRGENQLGRDFASSEREAGQAFQSGENSANRTLSRDEMNLREKIADDRLNLDKDQFDKNMAQRKREFNRNYKQMKDKNQADIKLSNTQNELNQVRLEIEKARKKSEVDWKGKSKLTDLELYKGELELKLLDARVDVETDPTVRMALQDAIIERTNNLKKEGKLLDSQTKLTDEQTRKAAGEADTENAKLAALLKAQEDVEAGNYDSVTITPELRKAFGTITEEYTVAANKAGSFGDTPDVLEAMQTAVEEYEKLEGDGSSEARTRAKYLAEFMRLADAFKQYGINYTNNNVTVDRETLSDEDKQKFDRIRELMDLIDDSGTDLE